jgi:hypothetical protein
LPPGLGAGGHTQRYRVARGSRSPSRTVERRR